MMDCATAFSKALRGLGTFALLLPLLVSWDAGLAGEAGTRRAAAPTAGSLQAVDSQGKVQGLCPLTRTEVKASISGMLARVVLTQHFENPFPEKIEAVYTFPLPQNAAVDDMTLVVGDRTVYGRIKRREEALAIYDAARAAGRVAALLDQERPNIFTQSVANIMPGMKVRVTISYVEILSHEDGAGEFVFPMVVGPRYIPGAPTGRSGGGWAPDTDRVPDASRITPPVALDPRSGAPIRAGHDISVEVRLDAGLPIRSLRSVLHEVDVERIDARSAIVRLRNKAEIPNRDFILQYGLSGEKVEDGVLAHRTPKGGYFTLILQPPARFAVKDVTPKEIVFVLDTSGSMRGFPIEKAKETIGVALDGLNPRDTFNLITFAGDTHILFPEPMPATGSSLRMARDFLASRSGSGGTEMMKAIRAALEPSDRGGVVRIVCFMTDGYVGNDMAILAEVQKYSGARVFSFGIGNSVNRFLLDRMASYGRGEVEYVTLSDDGSAAARRFYERVRNPLLTDLTIEVEGLGMQDLYPRRLPDLFSAKPIVVSGRYAMGGSGRIRLAGRMAGQPWERQILVRLPEQEKRHDVLATLWARLRVDDLMGRDYKGIQHGQPREEIKEEIVRLGLEHRLMTQYTSFVAVEEKIVTDGGKPRRVEVPVEMPSGVSPEGVFGRRASMSNIAASTASFAGVPGGVVGGLVSREGLVEKKGVAPSAQDQDDSKLHPDLRALARNDAAALARLTRNGKVEVRVWLTRRSPEAMEQLRKLGFEVILETKGSNVVVGRLPVEKIEELSKLDFVRYVSP